MGNFITAVILLTFLIIFTGINSFIICDICDDMIALVESGDIDGSRALWEKKRGYIAVFVRDAEIDVVSAEMDAAGESIANEDGEAEKGALALIESINELKHGEKPSFDNIFIIDIKRQKV